jgi:hypothetical protein
MSTAKMCHVSDRWHSYTCEVHNPEKSFNELMRRVVLVKTEKKPAKRKK